MSRLAAGVHETDNGGCIFLYFFCVMAYIKVWRGRVLRITLLLVKASGYKNLPVLDKFSIFAL